MHIFNYANLENVITHVRINTYVGYKIQSHMLICLIISLLN